MMDEITPRDIRVLVNASTVRYRDDLVSVSDATWVQIAADLLSRGVKRSSPGWEKAVAEAVERFLPDAIEMARQMTVVYATQTRELGALLTTQAPLASTSYAALSQEQMQAIVAASIGEIMKVDGGTFTKFAPMVLEGSVMGAGRDELYTVTGDDQPVRRPNPSACRFCITMASVAPYSKNAFHKGCRCVMEPTVRGIPDPRSKRIDLAGEYYEKARKSLMEQGLSLRSGAIMSEQRRLLEAAKISIA